MKITVTAREIMDKGVWMEYCELSGTNEWAMNEGLMDDKDEVTLNEDEAIKLGFLPEQRKYGY